MKRSVLCDDADNEFEKSLIYPRASEVTRRFGGKDQRRLKGARSNSARVGGNLEYLARVFFTAATKLSDDPEDILPQEDGEELKLSVFHVFSAIFPEEAGKGGECSKRLRLHFNKVGYNIYGKEQSRRVPAVRAKPGNPGYGFRRAKWRNTLTDLVDSAHCEQVLSSAGFDRLAIEKMKHSIQQIATEWDSVRRPSRPAGPGRPRRDHEDFKAETPGSRRRCGGDDDAVRDRQRKRCKLSSSKSAAAPSPTVSDSSEAGRSRMREICRLGHTTAAANWDLSPLLSHADSGCNSSAQSENSSTPPLGEDLGARHAAEGTQPPPADPAAAAAAAMGAPAARRSPGGPLAPGARAVGSPMPSLRLPPPHSEPLCASAPLPAREPHAAAAAALPEPAGPVPKARTSEPTGWEPVLGWRWLGSGGLQAVGAARMGLKAGDGPAAAGPLSSLHLLAAAASRLPREPAPRVA